MRIISGSARGRKLATPPGKSLDIRPTSDKARGALFSILAERTVGSRVLDLFAGTGALGLEAHSRGAASVVLVEQNPVALRLIVKNISIVAGDRAEEIKVLRHDLRKGLPADLEREAHPAPFDLIFLDPPYGKGLTLNTLEWLGNSKLLGQDSIVIAEERSSEKLPEQIGNLVLFDQRRYGETGFWLYSSIKVQETS